MPLSKRIGRGNENTNCEIPEESGVMKAFALLSDENSRIHVATFDASDGNDYNSENCEIAMDLFRNQEGVTVKYWCEKGRFKK